MKATKTFVVVISGIILLKKVANLWAHGAKHKSVAAISTLNSFLTIGLLAATTAGRLELCARSNQAEGYFLTFGTIISVYFVTRLRSAYVYLNGKRKSVLITGCDSGFGNALAKHMSHFGLKVYACCLNVDSEGTKELQGLSENGVKVVQLDVTKNNDVERVLKLVEKQVDDEEFWGLVNNAGVVNMGEIELVPLNLIHQHLEVNTMGTIRMCKAFLRLVRQSQGRIVNISSVMGKAGLYNLGGYAASKHAIECFSYVLSQEMRKWGVCISTIAPGPYKTGLADPKDFEDYIELLWEKAPDDVKETYGKDYFDAYLKLEDFASDSDISPVILSIEDALLSRQPKRSYTMGSGCYLVPFLSTWFPSFLHRSTHLMQMYTFYTNMTPAALK